METISDRSYATVASPRDLDGFMESLQKELENRLNDPQTQHPTKLVCIANLSRFRELRKGDDLPTETMVGARNLMRYFQICSRMGLESGYSFGFGRYCGNTFSLAFEQSIRDGELRVLMQMSANDSNQLIDSNIANRLEAHVALIQDDMDGKPIKFRPFSLDSILSQL